MEHSMGVSSTEALGPAAIIFSPYLRIFMPGFYA